MGNDSQVGTQLGCYFLLDSRRQQGMGGSLPLRCCLSATGMFLADTDTGLLCLLDSSDQLGTLYRRSRRDPPHRSSSLHRIAYIHTCKHALLVCCKFLWDTCTHILGRSLCTGPAQGSSFLPGTRTDPCFPIYRPILAGNQCNQSAARFLWWCSWS